MESLSGSVMLKIPCIYNLDGYCETEDETQEEWIDLYKQTNNLSKEGCIGSNNCLVYKNYRKLEIENVAMHSEIKRNTYQADSCETKEDLYNLCKILEDRLKVKDGELFNGYYDE